MRRHLLALIVGALAIASCSSSHTVNGIRLDAIPEGTSVQRLAGHSVFVVRHDDAFKAFLPDVRHLPGDSTLWWCSHERQFVSPTHGEFFTQDGKVLGGPARGDLNRLTLGVRQRRLVCDRTVIIGPPASGDVGKPGKLFVGGADCGEALKLGN
jgi:nitrite reductase/ring-hydroxylating ferredoxin subunit